MRFFVDANLNIFAWVSRQCQALPLYSTKDQVVAPKSQGLKVLIYLGCQTFFPFYQMWDCSIKGWRVYLVLNRGGSGTSKSIPLRLWYLGSGYVFGKYLFFIFKFTQFDTIAQSWGQLPIFFLRSYLKSKIRREIPLILLTWFLLQHRVNIQSKIRWEIPRRPFTRWFWWHDSIGIASSLLSSNGT